jgi:hypothetical protein
VPVRLTINLTMNSDDVLSTYSAGAKLYLDSAASEAGSYTNVTSTTIVSGTEQYELVDANGTSSTWYKTRVGNSAGSSYSDYSDPFQATSLAAYATLDDLLESMDVGTGAGSSGRRNLLADLLVDATDLITQRCGRSFFRSPQVSGTATHTFNVVNPNARTLSEAIGRGVDVLSVTTLEYRESSTGSYTAIAAGTTGYLLDSSLTDLGTAGTVVPYDTLRLSADSATRTTYPTGDAAIRLVGALGWPRVPPLVKRATIDLARQWYRQGPGGGPQQLGVTQFGTPILERGLPDSFYHLLGTDYRRQTFAAWV